jgi:hypothetical protein
MNVHIHVLVTPKQHEFLKTESHRTGLSMGELVRRALDRTYRPQSRPAVRGFELSLGLWDRPPAAIAGRRRLGV